MPTSLTKALLTITAAAAFAVPAAAQARQGADDPAGHARHGAAEVHRHHNAPHHAGSALRHARHGADDGPLHG